MRVLIADQHPIVYSGISELISKSDSSAQILKHVNTGEQLSKALTKEFPNILILELDLPNIKGIQTIRDIKKKHRGTKIFVLSNQSEEIYALSTIKAGASAYVCKTSSSSIIKEAFECVAKGGIYINDNLSEQLAKKNYKKNQFNTFKKLSTREIEVLKLLSSGQRNKEIASKLEINEKTVSTYKTRLLKKMKVTNLADLINQSRILHLT